MAGTMEPEAPSADDPARRRFLGRLVASVQAVIGATLGVVLGGSIVWPGLAREAEEWLSAAHLNDLEDDVPTPVTVRTTREDGYQQVAERQVLFLVRRGDAVTALVSTCTHLGCRVSWDVAAQELRCLCHGGAFDRSGAVKAGPPPAPLPTVATKIEDGRVLVRV